jgi:outer membrane biosynthesis protein TonB
MNIKIEADKPLLNLLERLVTALERFNDLPEETPEVPTESEPTPAPVQAEKPEPKPEPAPEPEKPVVTIDQIRKQVVTLSAMGQEKKDAVRDIITAYGRNVSAVPPEKYAEVLDRLTGLMEG